MMKEHKSKQELDKKNETMKKQMKRQKTRQESNREEE